MCAAIYGMSVQVQTVNAPTALAGSLGHGPIPLDRTPVMSPDHADERLDITHSTTVGPALSAAQ